MHEQTNPSRADWLPSHLHVYARGVFACTLLIVLFLRGAAPAGAQEQDVKLKDVLDLQEKIEEPAEDTEGGPEGAEKAPKVVEDSLKRGTPRSSALGLIAAQLDGDYERAAQYYDLRRAPLALGDNPGPTLARQFALVAERKVENLDIDSLSKLPEGHLDDGLPPSRERVGRITSKHGDVELFLERVPREDGVKIWKVASRTVAEIPRLYEEHGYGQLPDILPAFFFSVRFLYIELWQWVALVLLALLCVFAGRIVSRAVEFVLGQFWNEVVRALGRFLHGPLSLFVALVIFLMTESYLRLGVFGYALLDSVEVLLLAVVLGWMALRSADAVFETVHRRFLRRGKMDVSTTILPAVRAFTKVLIVTVALLMLVDHLGFKVTAFVAGLGVGGLALALAAQKSVENFIGAIALYVDQPVRVGDFCRFGDELGTVEEIGLRSSRIRTLDRTVVSVPNAEFANLRLNNFNERDKIWYHPTIGLRCETTPDQLRCILVDIRTLLYSHPKVDPDGPRVRFIGFSGHSFDLEIFAYVSVTDYGEFLEVAEDLNLRIMDIVTEAGSEFAVPSHTTYIEGGEPLKPERVQAAEARVQEWREKNELFLPRFPDERIVQLRGTVPYPPVGSPDGPRHHA